MMDSDSSRPSNELFICFTSRLSSSNSMKNKISSSKSSSSSSIITQSRSRDQPISLSNSLSRKLKSNGSLRRGQASPMFGGGNSKKRSGCNNFENPEPSSPKVTCIGQVRMKTKKHGRKMRAQRSLSQGFQPNPSSQLPRECRNQRWVHLPLTICEALKGFGSEFSCLFPCRSSCFSKERREKVGGSESERQSSSVCARWLVALQDGEGGKRREIELVVGGGDDEEEERRDFMRTQRSLRRHVFDEIEIRDVKCGFKDEVNRGGEEDVEEGRVSICIPPKNALLLMRCRSDPMKMSTLVSRLCEPTVTKEEEEEDDDDEDEVEDAKDEDDGESEEQVNFEECGENVDRISEEANKAVVAQEAGEQEEGEEISRGKLEIFEKQEEEIEETEEQMVGDDDVILRTGEEQNNSMVGSCPESVLAPEHPNFEENEPKLTVENAQEERRTSNASINSAFKVELEGAELLTLEEGEEKSIKSEKVTPEILPEEEEGKATREIKSPSQEENTHRENDHPNSQYIQQDDIERETVAKKQEREIPALPDCLLLMMCEPKLSMEVSRETWVCSTDFIRRPPQERRTHKKTTTTGPDQHTKVVPAPADSNPPIPAQHQPLLRQPPLPNAPQRPPRSSNADAKRSVHRSVRQSPHTSCSFPAPDTDDSSVQLPPRSSCSGVSMAAMIEQKLVDAVGYEPFVLTRCKSAPIRTANKLALEPCFWKDGKMEPHRCATFGVGAAGVGC